METPEKKFLENAESNTKVIVDLGEQDGEV